MQLEDFLPLVLPYARGCNELAAEGAVRQAAAEFCDKTDAWVQDLDGSVTEESVSDYDLELDSQATMVRLLRVTVGGKDITFSRRGDVPYSGNPYPLTYAIALDRATLRLIAAPTTSGLPISVTAALAPSPRAVRVDDVIARPHQNAIVDGALARLLTMPGEFHDPRSAEMREAKFQEAIRRAKTRAFYANAHGAARVVPQFF